MNTNNESPAALLPDAAVKNEGMTVGGFVPDGTYSIRTSDVSCRIVDERFAQGWNECRREMQELASTAPGASESRGSVPDGYAVLPRETTDEMQDAVRYLLVGLEQPGRTFGSVRKHCEWAGMDVSHWPAWTRENDNAHFTKPACAAILWHCMQHAAPTPPAVSSGEPPDWAIAQRNALRRLVDAAWNAATDSQEVPSTSWADELIDSVFARSAAAKGEG